MINRMNNIKNKLILICFLLLISQYFLGCKKDNAPKGVQNTNPPTIAAVTDLASRNIMINAAIYGDWIIIKGTNLATTYKVEFSNIAASDSLIYADDSTITVKIPSSLPDPVNNPIKVTTKYGVAIFNFKILQPPPFIAYFNPIVGNSGTQVTITGDYFLGVTSVLFNTTPANIISSTKTEIVVQVPSGISSGYIFVTTPSGTTKSATSFGLNYIIYDDVLNTGWSNTSYSSVAVLNNTTNVLRGTNSIKNNYSVGFGGFRLSKATPAISLAGYSALKFSVFGSTNSSGYKIRIMINGVTTITYSVTLPAAGVWTQYEIPFTSLGNPTTLTSVELKEWSGKVFEVFFDDIGLL